MKYLYSLVIILILSGSFYKVEANAGDSCTHPLVAQLCGQPPFSGNANLYTAHQNVSWVVGSKTYVTYGPVIYYQINLPASSYQPVSIQASFTGYFPNCNGCYGEAYLLWFENSPCSSNPLAITKLDLTGQPTLPDSIFANYNITAVKSQYYVVLAFNSPYNYQFSLQFGFNNNQAPPSTTCTVGPGPYRGELQLDKSGCYTKASPFDLPLSVMNDNPFDINLLFPTSLNQTASYIPVDDDNDHGFALTIKSVDDLNEEAYRSFDNFPYTYSTSSSGLNVSDVAITVFFKSNGSSGIKGFRMQVPNVFNFSAGSASPNGQGIYNTIGNWMVTFDVYTNTYTWLFNSPNGRGDNVSSDYGCLEYTFDAEFDELGDTIKAWYLPDNYGNDSLICTANPSVPPRTDCGLLPSSFESDWVPIGVDGSGNGITGSQCGSISYFTLTSDFYCNENLYTQPYISYDDSGCMSEQAYVDQATYPDFSFSDQFNSSSEIDATICAGSSYSLGLLGNGNYPSYYNATPAVLIYSTVDGFYLGGQSYNFVNSQGQLGGNVYLTYGDVINANNTIPGYPLNVDSFQIPLTVPGYYTVLFTDYTNNNAYDSDPYYQWACNGQVLHLTVDSPLVTIPGSGTSICSGNSVPISYDYGNNNSYSFQWNPSSSYSSATQTVSPTITTTYTIYATDDAGCTDTINFAVQVNNCNRPTAGFTMADSICAAACTTPTNTSSVSATSWNWTFTGGNPSSFSGKTPPSVCYANTGKYAVQLIVGNSNGKDTATSNIVIKDCSKPTATFSVNNICAGTCTSLSNISSVNATSWKWNFTGGNPSTFNGQTPSSICYNTPGRYPVQLIASNNNGTDTVNRFITVDTAFIAGVIQTPRDTVCYGVAAPFTLAGSYGSVHWQSSDSSSNFSDITGAGSTKYKIQAAYNDTYLKVIAGSGLCADTSPMFKLVVQPPLTSKFTWTTSGLTAFFNSDSSVGNINKYSWDFGDNTTNDSANPSHTFVARDSAYYVCLTLLDGSNCSYTYCHYVKFIIDNINEITGENSVNAYPNPFSNYFLIQFKSDNNKMQRVELFDVLGRILITDNLSNVETELIKLDIPDLPEGIYYLKVETNNATYVQKLFKVTR